MNQIKTLEKPPYLMIGLLFFATFVAFLNNSLLNVALPSIKTDFNIESYATIQWLSTGYMLVSGILIPVSAFLLTRFTNRALFLTSFSIFTLGTLVAAIAPSFGVLLAGRMIQAVGSASMSPLLMNIMLISFPREKRGAAMGLFGLVMIVAPAIGPPLSGYIVQYYEWRVLFGMILPFALIVLVLAIWKFKSVMPTQKTNLDYFSVVLCAVGFGGLLYGCSVASSRGWTDAIVLTTLICGILGIIWFVRRQFKLDVPLLDLNVFKHPMFALSALISAVNSAALFSGMILTPAYVQDVRGIDPFDAGLLLLPGAIVMGIMSPITGKLFDKFGPKLLAVIGLLITGGTTYAMSFMFDLEITKTAIVILYCIRMLGISLVMMPIMTNGLNQLPSRLNPHGTATSNTINQVAGSLGTALFVSVMYARQENSFSDRLGQVDPSTVTPELQMEIGRLSLLDGIQFSFVIAAITTALALILSFFIKRVDTSKEAVAKIEAEEN